MRTLPELEQALTHLLRMKELAEFYSWPKFHPEDYQRICSLYRGACELRRQMAAKVTA